ESVDVERAGDRQRVAARMRGDLGALTERLAKVGHVDLDAVLGGLGCSLAPERLDDLVDRDDVPAAQDQQREERAGVLAAQRDRPVTVQRLERSEDPEFHVASTNIVRTLAPPQGS